MSEKYVAVPVTILRVLPRSVIVTTPDDQEEHVMGRSTLHYADDRRSTN
ncbi:MAG: hypothetical protein ABI216_15960 [Devosia sp.]